MKTLLRLLASVSTAACLAPQTAVAAEPTPQDLHAARCVAALEASSRDLALQVKAGKDDLRTLLMDRLVAGTAFVGEVYLHSHVDERQARELANQALEAQKTLSDAELAARQGACAAEGARLYAAGNGLQQSIVRHMARKRLTKLLGA